MRDTANSTAKLRYARTLAAASVVGLLCSSRAHAQSASDSAAAQGLFDDAKALMTAGKAAEACPKFEESQRLDPASGTLMNLAKCYEETGRLASAWTKYLEAAAAAKSSGNADRESGARAQAAALSPRVSKLVLNVPPEARVTGLEISRDGEVVGPPQWGLAIPEDTGPHPIVATAPGRQAWKTIAVVAGQGTTTTVDVLAPPLATAPGAANERVSSGLGSARVLALVAGGVGVAAVGVGTVFGVAASSNWSDAKSRCNPYPFCDAKAFSLHDDAEHKANVATALFIVGGVGLAAGAVLWFTAPKREPQVDVGVGLGSVVARGSF